MRLIDAHALYREYQEKVCDGIACHECKATNKDGTCKLDLFISTAPTIEAVQGKWTEKEVIQDKVIEEWQSARCSNCGKYHTTPYMYYFDDYNFCPNCGAKMKGVSDETD